MIYIDLDDVVCETCVCLSQFAATHFQRNVPVNQMLNYDLRVSFQMDEATYRAFMRAFHTSELLSIPAVPQACETLQAWQQEGLNPTIVTGRPTYCSADTRAWLEAHHLGDLPLIHVDKYATLFNPSIDPLITPFPALQSMDVQFAIEDAPNAVRMLVETNLCPFTIFQRPWNQSYTPPTTSLPFFRSHSWTEINTILHQSLQS